MAITFIANALGATNSTTTFSITLPATAAGDILILEFCHRGTGDGTIAGTSVTTDGLTWTLKKSQTFASSAYSGKTYWTRATGDHAGKTVTGASLTNSCAAIVTQYRGAKASGDPLADATIVGEENASGNETQAEITTNTAGAWVVLVVVNSPDLNVSSGACTSPGALTEQAERLSTGGTDTSTSHWSAEKAAAGATGAFTWAQTDAASGSWAYAIEPCILVAATGADVSNASDSTASAWNQFSVLAEIAKASDTASARAVGQDGAVGSHEFHIPFAKHYSSQRVVLSKAYWIERTGKPKVAVETAVTVSDIIKASDTLAGLGTRAAASAEVVKTSDALVTQNVGQDRATALRLASRVIISRTFWIEYRAQDANASVVTAATASDIVKTSDTPVTARVLFATLADIVKASDTVVNAAVRIITLPDGIKASDTALRYLTIDRSLADIIKASDTLAMLRYRLATLADITKASDTPTKYWELHSTIADICKLSDTLTKHVEAYTVVADISKMSDAVQTLNILGNLAADGIKLTDDVTTSTALIIAGLAYSGITLTDAALKAWEKLLSSSSGIEVSDTGNVSLSVEVRATEGIKLSDAVAKIWELFGIASEGIKNSDSIGLTISKAKRYAGKIRIEFTALGARVTFSAVEPEIVAAGGSPKMVFKVKK